MKTAAKRGATADAAISTIRRWSARRIAGTPARPPRMRGASGPPTPRHGPRGGGPWSSPARRRGGRSAHRVRGVLPGGRWSRPDTARWVRVSCVLFRCEAGSTGGSDCGRQQHSQGFGGDRVARATCGNATIHRYRPLSWRYSPLGASPGTSQPSAMNSSRFAAASPSKRCVSSSV